MNRRKVLAFTAFPLTLFFSLLLTFSLYIYSHRQAVFTEAAFDGNLPLMKAMLAIGANVHSPGCPYERCFIPIIAAAWTGHNDAVQFLLDRGADVNAKNKLGTALMAAAYHGHVETVKLLLSRGGGKFK
jgi:ankyrin repeat protein